MRFTAKTAFLFVLPALSLYVAFVVYPALRGVALSLTDAQGVVGGGFVGLQNYQEAIGDPAVLAALRNTLVFTVFVVVVQNALGLGLAYWMQRQPRVRAIARAGTLLPAMMALVTVGYVWSFIYSPLDGPLNSLLGILGLSGFQHVWLGDSSTALIALAVTIVWMYCGYTATIYLSGYLSIPASIFEAAQMDGASGWARFRRIDWPLLAPALTVNLTLTVIGSLRVFDPVLVMTQGGPGNATQSLSYLVYKNSFQNLRFGYASTIAVLLLALTVLVAFVQTSILRRREVSW